MEQIAGVAVGDLGPTGLLALTVLLVLIGALIPRTMHKTIVGLLQQRIDKLEELLAKRDGQIDRLLPSAETSAETLAKIQSVTDPDRSGGER
ncbi:hypothetical protein GS436_02795 [Rhodococcus hoagii]|uniref:Uncharacterized protein n=1 Tax=Rhodococcus hoagii TaxID=43767 RepID=A0AAE2W4C5_RHOHA|nr:hypothetical protein [Prescottella equi]MBM4713656.1 hypothetical protein [Prescottella equi]NKR57963.1 hypothetical protein [Prescottella equi]NKR61727.1 hypothetical protein [Prescottella equi]NKS11960.1 hypothetical protein [Prescottella equi]